MPKRPHHSRGRCFLQKNLYMEPIHKRVLKSLDYLDRNARLLCYRAIYLLGYSLHLQA